MPFPRVGGSPRPSAGPSPAGPDRKSTRLNSSHSSISYAVFCLKKKTASSFFDQRKIVLLQQHLLAYSGLLQPTSARLVLDRLPPKLHTRLMSAFPADPISCHHA